jgi:ribonuclease BN (tRNA processing enzyme)
VKSESMKDLIRKGDDTLLNFIGSGSAFNTKFGNNGAFIKEGDILFLIDCGSSTFERLQRFKVLDGVNHIYVLMTHTHPDHVGSLGDLIFYGYYNLEHYLGNVPVKVFAPFDLTIRHLLRDMGVDERYYDLVQFDESSGVHFGDFHIQFESVPVSHVDNLKSFGYIIRHKNKKCYYSGDCNAIPSFIIDQLENNNFDLMYQDTCKADYEGNVHLSLRELSEIIDLGLRHKVFCMHLDSDFNKEEAESLGFNVVLNFSE